MFNTSELDELFRILISIKGFKLKQPQGSNTTIQIMTIMAILFAIIWLCIQIWNCINTRNLDKLQEKLTFMKFLYADKTDLYIQFMSNYITWSVYLGSVYDNLEGIEAVGQFLNGYVT